MRPSYMFFLVFMMISLIVSSQPDLNTGLVAYYPFSGDANDFSGNENHGLVVGAKLTSDRFDEVNSAYEFNGITDVIRIANSNSLYISDSLTIAAWINVENKELPYLGRIVAKHPADVYIVYGLFHGNDNYIYSQIDDGELNIAPTITTPDNIIDNETWEFLVFSWDGKTMKIYVNGELVSSKLVFSFDGISYSETALTIGNGSNTSGIYGVKGKIDDVLIYARTLNAEEIMSIFMGDVPLIDYDGDGFLGDEDCDEYNVTINPDALEIPNNGIDEDCDGEDLITGNRDFPEVIVNVYPNPTGRYLEINAQKYTNIHSRLYSLTGELIMDFGTNSLIDLGIVTEGIYLLEMLDQGTNSRRTERIVVLK